MAIRTSGNDTWAKNSRQQTGGKSVAGIPNISDIEFMQIDAFVPGQTVIIQGVKGQ